MNLTLQHKLLQTNWILGAIAAKSTNFRLKFYLGDALTQLLTMDISTQI